MICDLLALRPISHITKKTLSYLHSTKIKQMSKTMVIKRGAIFLCCIRCDPIPPQTSVQRLAHTRNVTTCCLDYHISLAMGLSPRARFARGWSPAIKSDGQEISTIEWQVLKNRFPSFFVHK